MTDFERLWADALTFSAFVDASDVKHRGLWEGIHKIARVPAWAIAAVPPGAGRRLLVIAEDWCGDASNTVPLIARLAEAAPGLELRVVLRDQHPDLMDRYLTNSSRSIPIVIALNDQGRQIGHWGPRPAVLQAWVMANRATTPKAELYPKVRQWYARDRGESTLREVLAMAGLPATQAPEAAAATPV